MVYCTEPKNTHKQKSYNFYNFLIKEDFERQISSIEWEIVYFANLSYGKFTECIIDLHLEISNLAWPDYLSFTELVWKRSIVALRKCQGCFTMTNSSVKCVLKLILTGG